MFRFNFELNCRWTLNNTINAKYNSKFSLSFSLMKILEVFFPEHDSELLSVILMHTNTHLTFRFFFF